MMNDVAPELSRRERAVWGAFEKIQQLHERAVSASHRVKVFWSPKRQAAKGAPAHAKETKTRLAGYDRDELRRHYRRQLEQINDQKRHKTFGESS
uniref:Transposase n=1 Tax=Haemonchus contortus TaxID=6289 RepID=A0A7I4YM12_HAECO